MRGRVVKVWRWSAALLVWVLVVACSAPAQAPSASAPTAPPAASEPTKLNLGLSVATTFEFLPAYVALDRGTCR